MQMLENLLSFINHWESKLKSHDYVICWWLYERRHWLYRILKQPWKGLLFQCRGMDFSWRYIEKEVSFYPHINSGSHSHWETWYLQVAFLQRVLIATTCLHTLKTGAFSFSNQLLTHDCWPLGSNIYPLFWYFYF